MADLSNLDPDDELDVVPRSPSNIYGFGPERLARRHAALAQLRIFGDPVLTTPAAPVEQFDSTLRDQVDLMKRLHKDAFAAGLAANQIGVLNRVFIYTALAGADVTVVINPVIEWRSEETDTYEEGCLSVPPEDLWVPVTRALAVNVRAFDEHGKEFTIEATEHEARIIQHEGDHLDGILMIDRAPREERRKALRIIRETATPSTPTNS